MVCCFDARIRFAVAEFLRQRGIHRPDMVVIAGGALTLASPRRDGDRDFVLEQVRLAIRLHQAKRAFLMSHSDCATYGGLAAFKHDRAEERAHHFRELCRASDVVTQTFPTLEVERFFVTFDGVFSCDDEECAAAD